MTLFVAWLLVGGIVGWLACLIMGADKRDGILLNLVVGAVGALAGGLLISPMVNTGDINRQNLSVPAIFVAVLGAMFLLAVVNMIRTGRAR